MTLSLVRRGVTIDDLLGPADRRFFGNGYRVAVRELRGLRADGSNVIAEAGVTYPDGWPPKAGAARQPHLSTVDALVLTGSLVEAHLAVRGGLPPAAVAASWLSRIRIRAGNGPLEGPGLAAFGASVVPTGQEPAADGGCVTRLECRIGPMTVHADVHHPSAHPGRPAMPPPGDPLILPAGTGHRHLIDDVVVDTAGPAAAARLRMEPDGLPGPLLESRHAPSVTLVDAFVAALQLGQAMLYRLDELERDRTGTLWMRSAEITAAASHRPVRGERAIRAELRSPQILTSARKGRWRRAAVEAVIGLVDVRCSVAHALPGRTA